MSGPIIAIVDYGMANLRSVEKALLQVGGAPIITGDPARIASADQVVLPGVGAFRAAMANLDQNGLRAAVLEAAATKPFLGICLGLQMLFDESTEMGCTPGLELLRGRVVEFFADDAVKDPTLKVPHIGWNALRVRKESRLLYGIDDGERVYFVHSYYAEPTDGSVTAATADYGIDFCCAVEQGNIAATQFHPEKSGSVGLRILRNFVEWNGVVT